MPFFIMNSLFITFEGIDRAGKTTQIQLLSKFLDENKIDHIITREPGGNPVSEKIREILLNSKEEIDIYTELFLYIAGRKQHVEKTILPALKKNQWVICDRYIDSTTVYQGVFRNIQINTIERLHEAANIYLYPHITFYIDIPVNISEGRIIKSGNRNRMEMFNNIEAEKMRQMFIHLTEKNPQRITLIDGIQSIQTIHQKIITEIKKKMKL